ncbi:hypothetical protein D9M68_699990 [compost metagenome]
MGINITFPYNAVDGIDERLDTVLGFDQYLSGFFPCCGILQNNNMIGWFFSYLP